MVLSWFEDHYSVVDEVRHAICRRVVALSIVRRCFHGVTCIYQHDRGLIIHV